MLDRGWKYHPAARCALAFAVGVLLAYFTMPSATLLLVSLGCSLLLLIVAVRNRLPLVGITVAITVTTSGAVLYGLGRYDGIPVAAEVALRSVDVSGRVVGAAIPRGDGYSLLLEADSILYRNQVVHGPITLLVRVARIVQGVGAESLATGSRLALFGRLQLPSGATDPRVFDLRSYLHRKRITGVVTCRDDSGFWVIESAEEGLFGSMVVGARRGVRRFCREVVGGEEGDIVRGLILGERDDIDQTTKEWFRQSGTIHILSVSGLHVGVVLVLLFTLSSWIPGRWPGVVLLAGALTFCLALTGGPPSIQRAVTMAVAVAVARSSGRLVRPLNTLAAAALVVLVVDPSELFDPGFQYSFASVLAIYLFHAPVMRALRGQRLLRRWPIRVGVEMVVLSVAAQMGTLPIVLATTGYISWIAPLANLVAIPLASTALGASIAGCLFSALGDGVGEVFAATARLSLGVALDLLRGTSTLSWAGSDGISSGAVGVAAITGASVWLASGSRGRHAGWRGFFWLVVVVVVVISGSSSPNFNDGSKVLMLPIQGGSIVVEPRGEFANCYYWSSRTDLERIRPAVERFCGRTTFRRITPIAIDSIAGRSVRDRAIWNQAPPEIALQRSHILLRGYGRDDPKLVRREGGNYLRIDLGRELIQPMIVSSDSGRFSIKRF